MKSMKLKEITFKTTNEQMGINYGSSTSPAVMSEEKEEGPEYPYGLRICLDSDVVKALGFEELPAVGKQMKMLALVEVCSASMSETKEYGKKIVIHPKDDFVIDRSLNSDRFRVATGFKPEPWPEMIHRMYKFR